MRKVLVLVTLLVSSMVTEAHRLDEYLQATRVDVARDRIGIEIDLTPGVSIAADVFARIDRNGDRVVSGEEAEAYARQVLADVALELDARTLTPVLTRVEVPPTGEIREGVGTIRIEASVTIEAANVGRHWIGLRNNHQPERSVYLVNALLPRTPEISIARQTRDGSQREARIEYEVASTVSARASWVLFGVHAASGSAARRDPPTPRRRRSTWQQSRCACARRWTVWNAQPNAADTPQPTPAQPPVPLLPPVPPSVN